MLNDFSSNENLHINKTNTNYAMTPIDIEHTIIIFIKIPYLSQWFKIEDKWMMFGYNLMNNLWHLV